MTDDQGWQPPTGAPAGAAPSSSPWATPQSAPPAAQPVPAWQQQQQSTPGWTPPPKPGLIPLRPLSFGTIIGSSFRLIRRNPAPTFGLSVLLYGAITIGYLAIIGLLFTYTFSRISSASYSDQQDILSGGVALFALGSIIPVAFSIVAAGVLQGIISLEVSRATLGEKLKVRGLWRLAKGRFGALIGWALLLAAAIAIYVMIWTFAAIAAFAAIGVTGGFDNTFGASMIALLVALGFALVFFVLAAWIGTMLALVPSIIVLERLTLRESIKRSWSLMRGNFWRTLGIQLLISVIVSTASSIVTTPLSIVAGMASVLINPNGDASAGIVVAVVAYILSGMVGVVVGAIGMVMQSGSLALVYIDIRMRREGLDLELLHYVEAKQAGSAGVENPYLRLQSPSTTPSYSAAGAGSSPWA